MRNKNNGITLIALVITIIVLLILAGVAIATLTGDNGILTKAVQAKENTEKSAEEEARKLKILENMGTYNTGKTVEEAIEQDVPYEKNTTITDEFGNKITVPAGFKVVKDNPADPTPSVKDGIVVQDATYEGTIGSEFVWIPVGEIKKSETEIVTINLSRYTFDSEGNESDYSGTNKEENSKDTGNLLNYRNAIATDIEDFKLKASAERSGGYYIGRYEARVDNATLDETEIRNPGPYGSYNGSDTMWTGYAGGQLVIKPNSQIWNYVTENKASELSKRMYIGKTFTSDLMNSYAWDTATLFLQTFDDRTLEGKKVYSRQTSLNTNSPANQGTNKLETSKQDKICNIWDMASNCYEWTTETNSDTSYPCVSRGGNYYNSNFYTASRNNDSTTFAPSFYTFRPILYL